MSNKSNKTGALIVVTLACLITFGFLFNWLFPIPNLKVAQLKSSFNLEDYFNFQFKSQKLEEIVKKNVTGKDGTYAVVIEDLIDGERYAFNQDTVMPAASLYKLVLMAAIFKEVKTGSIKLTDGMSAKRSYLEGILGGPDFGYEDSPEVISYSVDQALTRVATISDNYAAIMLADKLRDKAKLKAMAKELGMDDTNFDGALITTTASDIAIFFRKLQKKEIVSESASEAILEYLFKAQLNDRIPKYLPKDIKIAHKTGELSRIRHNAGLVYPDTKKTTPQKEATLSTTLNTEKKVYLIVMMSQDLKGEDEAKEIMAQISKEVFEYLSTKK